MKLESIALENFRNYSKIEVNINSDLVLILGANASGKTNFLESIYFLSRLKSFRSPDQFLVKIGENYFKLAANVIARPDLIRPKQSHGEIAASSRQGGTPRDDQEKDLEVIVQVTPILKRSFKLNGQKIKRGLWQSFAAVLFIPTDLNLFSLGPLLRRRYLDDTLSQVSKNYAFDLVSLDHVLGQRKALLEKIALQQAQREELSFWNEQLITLTLSIGQERKCFLDFLNERLNSVYSQLSGFKNKFAVEYKTDAQGDLHKLIKEHEGAEVRSGQNLIGPHREDFVLNKDGLLNVYNSSRGELRSQILAIKFLQAEYLNSHDFKPIILLDDVFSELDEERRIKLLENLSGHQIFITTTEEHHLPEIKQAQKLKVENGQFLP